MDLEPDDSTKSDISRYALWLLLAYTANANRRYYRMSTTWLPHFVTNTFSLLLPDAVRALFPRQHAPRNVVEEIILRMIRNNPAYAMYVAPLALGYILSHPDFNIYKGDWAELEFAGFHLDSLPHSATAFALALLVCDTLHVTQTNTYTGWWSNLLRWGYANRVGVSFGVVALVTAFWEYSEYRIHHYEMRERGDITKINMQWSAEDTRKDVASNFIGWGLAMLWQRLRR